MNQLTTNGINRITRDLKVDDLRKLVQQAILLRRQAIVYYLARGFSQYITKHSTEENASPNEDILSWTPIESLSQLRAIVGGRFHNLKQRWVGAGFPLREHRGDREGKTELNQAGWLELSMWLNKQGFEVRIAAESDAWLFEIQGIDEG